MSWVRRGPEPALLIGSERPGPRLTLLPIVMRHIRFRALRLPRALRQPWADVVVHPLPAESLQTPEHKGLTQAVVVGRSAEMAPEYIKLANKLKGVAKVAAVDCDAFPELAKRYAVSSFPTIKVFPAEKTANPYTKQVAKVPVDYTGPRTGKKIAEFATELLPSFVTAVGAADGTWDAFAAADALPAAVLFTTKDATTPLYKALALRFKGRLRLAEAKATDEALVAQFGVSEFPAVAVVTGDGTKLLFDGTIGADALEEFFEAHAAPPPPPDEVEAAARAAAEAAKKAATQIAPCAAADLETTVLQSEKVYLVAFSSDTETCAEQREAAATAVTGLAGMVASVEVTVAAGDKAANKLAKYWGAEAVATGAQCVVLVLFPYGPDKADADAEVYEGELTDGKALQSFVTEPMPSFVQHLNAQSVEPFLAHNPQLPKVFLLSNKPEVPGVFKALALNYPNFLMFGFVSADESPEVVQQLQQGGKKLPAVLLASMGPPQPGQPEGTNSFQISPYSGPMSYARLSRWVAEIDGQLQQAMGDQQAAQQASRPTVAAVVEVTSDSQLDAACVSQGGLCTLVFLNPTAPDHTSRVEAIKEAAAAVAGQPFSFAWVDATRQPAFAAAFDVDAAAVPTAVVVSVKKLRYARLRGVLDSSALVTLMEGVVRSPAKTAMIQEMPSLVEGGVEPVEEELVEDEFDLSDIMDTAVDNEVLSTEQLLQQAEAELKQAAAQAKEEAAAAKAAADAEAAAKAKAKKKKDKKKAAKKAAKVDL